MEVLQQLGEGAQLLQGEDSAAGGSAAAVKRGAERWDANAPIQLLRENRKHGGAVCLFDVATTASLKDGPQTL